jgi:hypothetical protein
MSDKNEVCPDTTDHQATAGKIAGGRRLSVAPMMDWTEEGVFTEGEDYLL